MPTTYGPVRSPVRSANSGSVTPSADAQAIRTITTQATTDPTAGSANSISVGASYNGCCVWIGDRDAAEFYVNLYVNDGTRTRRFKLFRNQRVNIACAAGATLSFGATLRMANSFEGSPIAASIKVCPYVRPSSLANPSGASGTVNCDQNGPPFWSPSASHVTLAARNSRILIQSTSARQDVFMCEIDPDGNVSPVQHVIVPPNIDTVVECAHVRVAFATFDGSTLSIDAPTGATIGGTSVVYRPTYTAGTSHPESTAAGLISRLGNFTSGDEIVLASGTYDLSGTPVNPSNYSGAMGKTLRIRSATGDPADVTINGASWYINLADGVRWVIEGITFDFNGLAMQSGAVGLFCVQGGANASTHLHACDVNGPSSTVSDTVYAAMGKEGGDAHHYASLCNFSGPSTSGDLTSIASGANMNARFTAFACSMSGNGNAGSNQIITTHDNQRYDAYHCVFTDTGATGNVTRVTPDVVASPVYLMWCSSLAANFANADGLTIDLCSGIFACNLTKVSVCQSPGGYICLSTVVEVRSAVTRQFFKWDQAAVFGLCAGNSFTTGSTSADHGMDVRSFLESFGNEITGSSTNSIALRINTGTIPTNMTVFSTNDRFRTTSPSEGINLGTSAETILKLFNTIIDGYSGVAMTIGATGAACDSTNGYYRRAAAPTNWTTRFAATSGDTFSTTAPAVNGTTGVPTASGNCDATGADPKWYGGIDRYGRALLLSATPQLGPVDIQSIKATPLLIPAVW